MLAYLVIREGSKWTDVFRLVPGQSVTIGRAPTNQIVIKDERCSRNHAEVFQSQGQWTLRDLDSRNGTLVGGSAIRGDYSLAAGRHHSHRPLAAGVRPRSVAGVSRFAARCCARRSRSTSDDAAIGADVDRRLERAVEPTSRRRSRIAAGRPSFSNRRTKKTTTARCRRSAAPRPSCAGWRSSWPRRPTSITLAELALAGLFEGTQVDAGAVLLLPRDYDGEPIADDLEVVASRTDSPLPYHRVSQFLAVDRAARGRGRAGPQRDGRQHARQPRQQGRDPRHERDLRADSPRTARCWA